MSIDHPARPPRARSNGPDRILRHAVVVALIAVIGFFSLTTPSFLTAANLQSLLVNNFALLAMVSIGMTLVVGAGGIDLSIGAALDVASLAFVTLVLGRHPVWLAALAGIAAGGAVGLFNALLIVVLRITPFLATLGTLFIARSAQQLLTGGGNPIYLPPSVVPDAVRQIGHGSLVGVPIPLLIVAILFAAATVLTVSTRFGRAVMAIGAQPGVAWYSGLRIGRETALVYVMGALISAVAGLVLSATVDVYVPYSGNAFLLDAIGATFIGTTLSREGRPLIVGTLLGVLLLAVVANGLLLIGWNFYLQQVGTGGLIFLVLAASFVSRRQGAAA